MAYGPNAVGKDGNRGIDGPSPGSDAGAHMPDGFLASVGTLVAPGGLLGQPTMGKSRQDIPGSAEIQPREQYNFQSGGTNRLLGDYQPEGHIKDDEYPSLPGPAFPGESGTTNMGQQGDPVNWSGVAPYEYDEYPMSPAFNTSDPTASTGQ